MAPELVVADAPFKTYPGGVIAIKCDEWLAAARGSLTSGADALACTGTRVRDTQTVSASIADDVFAAYAEALDTLEIPFDDLPLEFGLAYDVLVSYRVPGEWDPTNLDTLLNGFNHKFSGVVALGHHGHANAPDEDNPIIDMEFGTFGALARTPHYVTRNVGGAMSIFDPQPGESLIIRAFAQGGTTAEWLLDQILLLPNLASYIGSPRNGWDTEDFSLGGNGLSGGHQVNAGSAIDPEDGTDGGDDNGKFTWSPQPPDSASFLGAGGDYQRKSDGDDAEYLVRVNEDDDLLIANSTAPGVEPTAHGYSYHGARYREAQDWVNDPFSRTTGLSSAPPGVGDWGLSPEGYAWGVGSSSSGGSSPQAGTNGSEGVMRARNANGNCAAELGNPSTSLGAHLRLFDSYSYSGTFYLVADPAWDDPVGSLGRVSIRLLDGPVPWTLRVRLDSGNYFWEFGYITGGSVFNSVLGPVDISSWYGDGAVVGWRIEVKRALIRMRVWDASGAEPSTWDYEDFTPIVSGGTFFYPYGDDARFATLIYDERYVDLLFEWGSITASAVSPVEIRFDDVVVATDPYGDPEDMSVRVERPEGSSIGEIVVPYGAGYLVYWGTRDWTEVTGGGDFGLALSARTWNDPGAAEMQRADGEFWYFRSVHGGIVSMNWRSADRMGQSRRVLRGS